jgi:ABC-2 type transport system permease protein
MSSARGGLAHTSVVLRQLVRDRTSLFFILVLPVAVIVIIGTTFGGADRLRLGIVGGDSELGRRVEAALAANDRVRVESFAEVETMQRSLRRFALSGGVVIPTGADADVARGTPVDITMMTMANDDSAFNVRRTVSGAIDAVAAPLGAAAIAAEVTGAAIGDARSAAERLAASRPAPVRIDVQELGAGAGRAPGRFARTAPQNLVLFTFINALTSATLLVQARRSGVLRRALAAPTPLAAQLGGMAAGWYLLCLMQSALIIVIGRVAFGVDWGSPIAGLSLVLLFAAVGCGAGLLAAALGGNEDRVAALTPPIGIVLATLGGCTVPIEVFPDSMVTVARLTPHYWAMQGWTAVVLRGEGVASIGTEIAVLGGYAAVLLALAVWWLRRALVAGR